MRGVFVAVVAGAVEGIDGVVITVTGGQLGQSLVTVRTLLGPMDVPGTAGGQLGHVFVIVEVEAAGVVVVTQGQLGQS